ncbi:MAG: hypothetical protein ACK562_08120 [Acidobacteriota bacterium]
MDRLIELFFKYRWPVFAKGEFSLANRPAWWIVALLITGIIALVYLLYVRPGDRVPPASRWGLLGLRTLLLLLLLFLIMRPVVTVPAVIPLRTSLAILIDDSRSMQIRDEGGRSRLEVARELLTREPTLTSRLAQTFRLRPYAFAGELTPLPGGATGPGGAAANLLKAEGSTTDPAGALEEAVRDSSGAELAAILLISDGGANLSRESGRDLAAQLQSLRSSGIPVFTIGVGNPDRFKDIELTRMTLPRRILVGSAITAELFIRASGGIDTANLSLRISEDGRVLKTQRLESREISPTGEARPVLVKFSPSGAGARRYSFELTPAEGETTTENNALDALVEVTNENPRILHLEGEPRWEYGKLRFSLAKSEKNVTLISVLRSADGKFYRQGITSGSELTTGFPGSIEELFSYDGLVLGSIEANFFSYDQLQLIEQFVSRRGGGLLALGGGRAFSAGRYARTPVADLLPVVIGEPPGSATGDTVATFKARLTERGRTHPVTRLNEDRGMSARGWEEMPALTIPEQLRELKSGAMTILEAAPVGGSGPVIPLLVEQRYGRGRSLALLASDTWRWRMELPSQNIAHETFWRQLLRYQISTTPRRFEVSAERDTYALNDHIVVRAELHDPKFEPVTDALVTATITSPSGNRLELPLELKMDEKVSSFRGALTATEAGLYQIALTARQSGRLYGEASSSFLVSERSREFFDAAQNVGLLKRIAAETGGEYYPIAAADRVINDITMLEGKNSERVIHDLWDMPINFLLVIALAAAEWFLRKREGLA